VSGPLNLLEKLNKLRPMLEYLTESNFVAITANCFTYIAL